MEDTLISSKCPRLFFLVPCLWFVIGRLQLTQSSTFEEVIWLFSRAPRKEDRITLAQNPQFYNNTPDAVKTLKPLLPLERPASTKHTYYILLDRSTKILFELRKPRVFGNIWRLQKDERIILKGGSLLLSVTYREC